MKSDTSISLGEFVAVNKDFTTAPLYTAGWVESIETTSLDESVMYQVRTFDNRVYKVSEDGFCGKLKDILVNHEMRYVVNQHESVGGLYTTM